MFKNFLLHHFKLFPRGKTHNLTRKSFGYDTNFCSLFNDPRVGKANVKFPFLVLSFFSNFISQVTSKTFHTRAQSNFYLIKFIEQQNSFPPLIIRMEFILQIFSSFSRCSTRLCVFISSVKAVNDKIKTWSRSVSSSSANVIFIQT